MKIVYAGTFSGYWVSDHYRSNGFKKVFDNVIEYDFREIANVAGISAMNKNLFKLVNREKPEVLFINNGKDIDVNIIRDIKIANPKTMIAYWYGDQRGHAIGVVGELAKMCDVLLLNNVDKNQWSKYKKMGVKNIAEHHSATDHNIYKPIKRDDKYDLIFLGSNYDNRFPESETRLNMIKRMHSKFSLIIYGGGWPNHLNRGGKVYGKEFANAVSRAKITLGINAYNNVYCYTSNRLWNSLACGKPHVTWYYVGMEEMFENWKHLVWFRDHNEGIKIIKKLLKDDELRKSIGENGRNLIVNKHTYYHRALELKEVYEEWVKRDSI